MAEEKEKTKGAAPGKDEKAKSAKPAFPSKEQKDKAKELLKGSKGKIFVNEKGEFFTSENLASLSVGNKKNDYALAYENK